MFFFFMTSVVKHWNRLPEGVVDGDIEDYAGWSCEQPNLTVGVPHRCRAVGLDVL